MFHVYQANFREFSLIRGCRTSDSADLVSKEITDFAQIGVSAAVITAWTALCGE